MVSYRAPAEPSSARVTAWRRLHRLGALYIGASAGPVREALHAGSVPIAAAALAALTAILAPVWLELRKLPLGRQIS